MTLGRRVGMLGQKFLSALLVCGLFLSTSCDCGSTGAASGALAEITVTSPVIADGTRASLVTVRLSKQDEPLVGETIEIVTDREDLDVVEQPSGPTDSDGVATGRVRSMVPGESTVSITLDGNPVEGTATILFVSSAECEPGEERSCYEGPEGTLDVGRCHAGTQVCDEDGAWGPCEGQVLPAEIDGVPCNGEDDNCDGTVDTHMDRSSPDNCGWCGNVCDGPPNVERICNPDTGECSLGDCLAGFYDLDGDPDTGCEYECHGDPEAEEVCDGTDTNCDGLIDGGPGGVFDVDGDGFSGCGTDFDDGGTDPSLVDCDDLDPDVYPGAPLLCDGKDNNCDGNIDAPDEDCDTGLVCLIGRCEDGQCVSEPLDCSHLDEGCEIGQCDEDAGGCVLVDAEIGATCEVGGCVGFCGEGGLCIGCDCESAADCEDGIACSVASCVDGLCVYEPDDGLCESDSVCAVGICDLSAGGCVELTSPLDGEACSMDDGCEGICDDGMCRGCECEDALDCEDIGDCGVAACVEGRCIHEPNDDLCDSEICVLGSCDPDTFSCSYDLEALDGEECVVGDCEGVCDAGLCGGCTCVVDEDCDDGAACSENTCDEGVCVTTIAPDACDDGNPCTVGICDVDAGGCVYDVEAADGMACDVGDCVGVCQDASCQGCPTSLIFTTSPFAIQASTCSPEMQVQTRDPYGPATVATSTTISLSSPDSPTLEFFSDPDCSTLVGSIEIPAGEHTGSFYIQDSSGGEPTVTASHDDLEPASQVVTILEDEMGEVVALVFASAAQTVAAGSCSDPVIFETMDAYGEAAPVDGDLTVNLGVVDSATLELWADDSCQVPADHVVVPDGASTGTFWFSDPELGSPTITISAPDLTGDSQTQSIVSGLCDGSALAPECTSDEECELLCEAGDCDAPRCVGGTGEGEQVSLSSLSFAPVETGDWTVSGGNDFANQGELYVSANNASALVIPIETSGAEATFRLWLASGRVRSGGGGPSNPTLEVLVNGAPVGNVAENGVEDVMSWNAVSDSVILSAGTHEVTLTCTGTSARNQCGVDGIVLTTDMGLDPGTDAGFTPYATADWDDPALTFAGGGTVGRCDASFEALDGTPCDEHLFCNGEATCLDGVCIPGDDPCDDGIECTLDICHEDTASCTNDPDHSLCDDGYDCSVGICDSGSGGCVQDYDAADGAPCEVNGCVSVCDGGICVGCGCLVDEDCDDGDPCTINVCEPDFTCATFDRAPDADSLVLSTATCLTAGAGGRAVVLVDLRDELGFPFEGAEVTFAVDGTEVDWVEAEVTESVANPGTYYRTLFAPQAGISSTISVQASGCGQTVSLEQSVTILYEGPVLGDIAETGGCSPQAGNLRVRTIDEDGNPIEGAFVMVGSEEDPFGLHSTIETSLAGEAGDSFNTAATDFDGYAVFFDAGLSLSAADIITAGAEDRAYVSLVSVGASDVVLELPVASPPMGEVEITGNVSGPDYPGTDNQLGVGLVVPIVDLDFLLSFDLGSLFEDDVTVIAAGVDLNAPANVHIEEQCIVRIFGCNAEVTTGNVPWTLRPYESMTSFDIFVLHATARGLDLQDLPDDATMADLIQLLTFRGVGLREGVPRDAGFSGQDMVLSHGLAASMQATISNAPFGELYLMSVSDLEGMNGLGRLMIQGMDIESDSTGFSTTLTTHDDTGDFVGKRDLAMGLSLEADGGGFSIEIDRVTEGRDLARSFETMFDFPEVTVQGRAFSWSGAVREGVSPDSYMLSRSVLRRDRPRGDWKRHSEPFWIVYAPGGSQGFELPDLPNWAPRAADEGYLMPETAEQTIRWALALPNLGLLEEPGDFDLDRHILGREVDWLTHVAGRTSSLP